MPMASLNCENNSKFRFYKYDIGQWANNVKKIYPIITVVNVKCEFGLQKAIGSTRSVTNLAYSLPI